MTTYHDYDDYNENEIKGIVLDGESYCDPGLSLRKVLDALVDANFQEAEEDPSDEEDYERRSLAKTFLFKLATALTNGHRNKND